MRSRMRTVSQCLLHARGGVSEQELGEASWALSSPRSWRCFSEAEKKRLAHMVFSTLVEVFPEKRRHWYLRNSLLHARGGVSCTLITITPLCRSSPRSWRCFRLILSALIDWYVFSTLVEVFLIIQKPLSPKIGLLHARGGVSLSNSL